MQKDLWVYLQLIFNKTYIKVAHYDEEEDEDNDYDDEEAVFQSASFLSRKLNS